MCSTRIRIEKKSIWKLKLSSLYLYVQANVNLHAQMSVLPGNRHLYHLIAVFRKNLAGEGLPVS